MTNFLMNDDTRNQLSEDSIADDLIPRIESNMLARWEVSRVARSKFLQIALLTNRELEITSIQCTRKEGIILPRFKSYRHHVARFTT